MNIIPGTNGELALKISRFFDVSPSYIQVEKLPYGEKYVRIPFEPEGKVYVVNTFFPYPDEILFESRLIGDILRERGAEELILIAPYLSYSRGIASIFGEAKTFETLMNILDVYDRIIAVDFYGNTEKVESVSAMPLLAEYISEECDLVDPVVLGPDEISKEWIRYFANIIESDYGFISKIRVDAQNVVVSRVNADVKDRDVIIADDIVATGSTVVQSAKKLKSLGARKIYVAATHALFSRQVYADILKAGVEDVISTDTVLNFTSRVSVSEIMADRVKF
ncbi:ribose-phosphate diphosphokinase [Geoglobus acetivorans]|uniref:ribose-phosphate diphosphokinase n=1 Tax=Geoglobus acetivorans TaxID=565033 RepID=A0A0A7GJM7_GEOAI|nr:phosphorybosyl pyrophosphate synthase [Geoglobus acetivorans]